VVAGHVLVCSGTWVQWRGGTWLLTAAHCLFSKHTRALRDDLSASGVALVVGRAHTSRAFAACYVGGADFESCLMGTAGDIALVPVGLTPAVPAAAPCAEEGADSHVRVFGYGLDHGQLPSALLTGQFIITSVRPGLALAEGLTGQMVNLGDSGGPATSAAGESCIGWVTSALLPWGPNEQRGVLLPASTGALAVLKPLSD
jgi:hypothetical protein